MGEIAVLGSTGKLTTCSVNQKTECNSGQEETSIFTMLFQSLTLVNPNQQQLGQGSKDSDGFEEILSELYSLMQASKQPQEDILSLFQGLSTGEQQDLLKLLSDTLGNQSSTNSAGQLKGFSYNEGKIPNNSGELTLLLEAMKESNIFSKLNAENNFQNNVQNNAQNNSKNSIISSHLKSVGLSEDKISKINNEELALLLKTLSKPEKSIVNNSQINTSEVDPSPVNEQKVQTNFIPFVLKSSFNQQYLTNKNIVTDENNGNRNIDIETLDFTKLGMQPLKLNVETDGEGLEVTNKQSNIEHLSSNRNIVEELGRIFIKSFKLPNGASETKIQLNPQELGRVDVKLSANNGQISAQIIAETALGKELLEGHIHQLKSSLVQQGYQVERIDVQQALPSSNLNNDFKGSNSSFLGQQSSKHYNREQTSYKYSNSNEDVDEFVQEMINVTSIDYTV